MNKCKYELKFNDEVFSFSSEEALDEFLLENYDNISLKIKGLRISASKILRSEVEDTKVKLAELEAAARKTGRIHNDYYAPFDEVVEVIESNSDYQAITKYINEKKALVGSEEKKIIMTYDIDNHSRFIISKYIKDQLGLSGFITSTDETYAAKKEEIYADPTKKQLLEDHLVKTLERFLMQNVFGRIVHNGIELGVKKLIELGPDKFLNKEYFDVNAFTSWNESNIRGVEFDDGEKVRFSATMYNLLIGTSGTPGLYQRLNLSKLKLVYSEFPISYVSPDGQVKLIGIIDLLIIDENGKAHIYDFKTSTNTIDQWSRTKEFRTRLQLGYYAQIIRNAGIEVLNVAQIPVRLESNTEFKSIQNIIFDPPQSVLSDLQGIDKQYRRIITLIQEDIPTKVSKEHLSEMNTLVDIDRVLKKTLNVDYRDKIPKEDIEAIFEHMWNKQKDPLKKSYYDKTEGASKNLPTDKEELKKVFIKLETDYRDKTMGGVLIDQYQTAFSIYKRARAEQPLIHKNEVPFVVSFKGQKGEEAKEDNVNFNKMFGKYKGEEWQLIENETAKQLGFMLFLNHVSKVVDIVSISNENLKDLHKLPHGKSLLGNVYNDTNFNVNNDKKIIESTKAHVELMKIMAFINFNTGFFTTNEYSIGDIKVVNKYSGGKFMTFEDLKYNFAKLLFANGLNTDYKLDNKDLDSANPVQSLLATIKGLDVSSNYLRLGFTSQQAYQSFTLEMNELLDVLDTVEFRQEKIKNQILDVLRQELKIRLKDRAEESFKNPTEADYFTRLIVGLMNYYTDSYIPQYEKGIFDHSLKLNTIGNLPSAVINGTRKILDTYIENIKTRFLDYKEKINPITGKLFDESGYSKFRRYTIGDHVNAYEGLFQTNKKDGTKDPRFLFKNPFDKTNGLTETQRTYLKTILTIMNDLKGEQTSIEEQHLKSEYKFLQVPLVKSQYISFLKKGDFATQWAQWVKKIHNPEAMLFGKETQENGKEHKMFLELKNSFVNQNGERRTDMLLENDISVFETDIEAVVDLFVLTNFRSQEFNKALPLVLATKLTSVMDNIGVLNDIEPLIDFINDHLKIVVKGENLIKPGLENVASAVSVGRHLTSMANLMMNPISISREMTQAFYGALSRAAVKMYGKNSHSLADLTKLMAIVVGESRKDIYQDMNIVESFNIAFGLSNMNLGSIIDRSSLTKTGMFHFMSNYMQGLNRAPEYMVRLSIFIAELIKDDAWKAYSFDEKDGLKYNWKKDGRFSTYATYKNNESNIPSTLKEKYFKQKGLYLTLLSEFNKDKDIVLTELPHAYTTRQTESIKAYADSILGYYDPKSKIHAQSGFIGMNFLHFKTWMVAVKDKWLLTGHKSEVQGQFILMKDESGNQVYITNTGQLTLEKEGNALAQIWDGKWCEGMLMSMGRLFRAAYGADLSEFTRNMSGGFLNMRELFNNDEVIQANLKLMLSDVLVMLLMFAILRMLFKTLWKDDVSFGDAILSAVLTAPTDLNPIRPASSLLKPNGGWIFPQFSYFLNVTSGLTQVVFGDKATLDWAMESFGMTRPIKFLLEEDKKLYVPSFSGPGGGQFGGGGSGEEF